MFVTCRKNHARAMESMAASMETEQKAKAEALRIKKKLEGDINEFEIALDHANKANNEALKSIKWLGKQRNSQGGFVSTQDTVVALQAISLYSLRVSRNPMNLNIMV